MYLLHWMKDKTPPLTSNHHHGHSKDFLSVCCRGNVSKANTRQAGHGEVQGGDVDGVFVRPALPLPRTTGVEVVRCAHRVSQDVEPAVRAHNVGFFIDYLIITDAVPEGWRGRSGPNDSDIAFHCCKATRLYFYFLLDACGKEQKV